MATKMAEMKTASSRPIDAPAWLALQAHYEKIKDVHLRRLFAEDPKRGTRLTAEGAGLFLDYSTNRVITRMIALSAGLASGRQLGVILLITGDGPLASEVRAEFSRCSRPSSDRAPRLVQPATEIRSLIVAIAMVRERLKL